MENPSSYHKLYKNWCPENPELWLRDGSLAFEPADEKKSAKPPLTPEAPSFSRGTAHSLNLWFLNFFSQKDLNFVVEFQL
jgi:hypothetical protein